jgi:hypothetical protein
VDGTNLWQLRAISGGSNYNSQDQPDAHFGLGSANIIEKVRIEWPSGIIQELENVAPNQTLVVKEPIKIESARPLGNIFPINFKGAVGASYSVEGTTNLFAWELITRFTNVTGIVNIPGNSHPWQFFRMRED